MRNKIPIAMAILIAFSSTSFGLDYWSGSPTWDRTDFDTTWQLWNLRTDVLPDKKDSGYNPYGAEPVFEIESGYFTWGSALAPSELDGYGWLCQSTEGGVVKVTIFNSLLPQDIKYIFLQVTSSKAPSGITAVGSGDAGPYTSGTWPTGLPHVAHPGPAPFGGSWYTYNYGLTIQPNPESEVILIEVPNLTVIDQIVVDTICIPEPTTITLLALGGLALIRRKK